MKILVTGASGYVGVSIFTNLSKHYELIGTFQKNKLFEKLIELDIIQNSHIIPHMLLVSRNFIIFLPP
jgi:dTDP-4-dehydrorhamnose reductase